jgi:phosphoserine phosphatase RsbU/P
MSISHKTDRSDRPASWARSRGSGPADPSKLAIAELQRNLLPDKLPETPGFEFAVAYRPCDESGGDFYGFQPFADGRLGMVVADIAGHGAPAAVMMAALRGALAAFRVFGRPRETAPQDINAVVHEIAVPGMFITAFFVSLDPRTGTLYCGNCGHPPAIIARADGTHEILSVAGDLPLGILPNIDPPMMTVGFGVGDTVVLYTDGLTEARDRSGEEFGERRLIEAVSASAGGSEGRSAASVRDAIILAVDRHQGDVPASDDQCVLVCRRLSS